MQIVLPIALSHWCYFEKVTQDKLIKGMITDNKLCIQFLAIYASFIKDIPLGLTPLFFMTNSHEFKFIVSDLFPIVCGVDDSIIYPQRERFGGRGGRVGVAGGGRVDSCCIIFNYIICCSRRRCCLTDVSEAMFQKHQRL